MECLEHDVHPKNVPDFLIVEKRKILKDPVIDPRENWKKWFYRVANFKDPPLVERDELPENLQP